MASSRRVAGWSVSREPNKARTVSTFVAGETPYQVGRVTRNLAAGGGGVERDWQGRGEVKNDRRCAHAENGLQVPKAGISRVP